MRTAVSAQGQRTENTEPNGRRESCSRLRDCIPQSMWRRPEPGRHADVVFEVAVECGDLATGLDVEDNRSELL